MKPVGHMIVCNDWFFYYGPTSAIRVWFVLPHARSPSTQNCSRTRCWTIVALSVSVSNVMTSIKLDLRELSQFTLTAEPAIAAEPPCTAHAVHNHAPELASPAAAEASANPATPAMNNLRCPYWSESRPPRSSSPPNGNT